MLAAAALGTILVLIPWLQVTRFPDFQAAPKQILLLPFTALALGAIAWKGPVVTRHRWLNVALGCYATALVLAYATAIDRRVALFGWYNYRMGVATLLCGPALFLAAAWLRTKGLRPWVLRAGFAGTCVVVIVAFLQEAGAASYFSRTAVSNRNNGGVGTANDLAAYLTLAVAFVPALTLRRRQAWATGACVALLTFGVVLAESRAGMVAFVATLAAVIVLLAVRGPVKQQVPAAAAVAAGLVLGVVMALPTGAPAGLIGRFQVEEPGANELELQASGSLRVELWLGGFNAAVARPLTGYGQDSLPYVFGRHRDSGRRELDSLGKALVASSHNLFLDTAANEGLLALAALLAVLALTLGPAMLRVRRREAADLWTAAGVGGYLVLQSLNPSSLPGMAGMWVVAGTLVETRQLSATRVPAKLAGRGAAGALAAVAVAASALIGVAESRAWEAKGLERASKLEAAANAWSQASAVAPWERRYRQGEFADLSTRAGSSADRTHVEQAAVAGKALHADFPPLAGELIIRAALVDALDPSSPEVTQLLRLVSDLEPGNTYWQSRIEIVAPLAK